MKRRMTISLICIILSLAMVLSSCGNTGSSSETVGSGKVTSKKNTLTIGTTNMPKTLDTMATTDYLSFHTQAFDPIIRRMPDTNELVPWLAKSWEVSGDGMEIVFHLRDDVKFHNGDIMTAEDVAFSINKSVDSPFTTGMSSSIAGADIIDDYTVKVRLKMPFAPALGTFATVAFLVQNKKAAEADPDGYGQKPIGTGPWKFNELIQGDRLVFDAFDDYWNGRPKIDKLIYKSIPDHTTQVLALEKGEIDMLDSNPAREQREYFLSNDAWVFEEGVGASGNGLELNNQKGPMADKRVRLALAYAIDKQGVIDLARNGVGEIAHTVIGFAADHRPLDFEPLPYDPEKSKQLLTEAGYPNGLELYMPTIDSPTYLKPSEVVQNMLSKVGINVKIDVMERGKFVTQCFTDYNYDIAFWGTRTSVPDADFSLYPIFHSDNMWGEGNNSNVNNPELDALLDAGRIAQDPKERDEIYRKACEIIRDEVHYYPILYAERTGLHVKELKGLIVPVQNDWNYSECWWEWD